MMDNLPKGWTSVPLKDIATVFLGKTPARSEYCSKGKYKVVKFRDLKSGHVDFSNAKDGYVMDKTGIVSSLRPLQEKDVLITSAAHSGENIGKKCAYIKRIPDQFEGIFFTGELLNIRAEYDETLAKWSYLYFLSAKGFKEIQSAVKGVHLTSGRANMMQIDIAPLNEQRRIVAKLEKLLQKVDACKERLDKIPAILKRFRQSILAAACSGRLTADWREKQTETLPDRLEESQGGDLPPMWKLSVVERLTTIGSGQSSKIIISKCQTEGEIQWFKVSDMNLEGNEKFMFRSQNYLSPREVEVLRMRIFPVGTVIFPKRGDAISTNKKRILTQPSCIDSNTMALTPHGCSSDYFWIWFCTVDLGCLSDGSNVPQINNPDILPLEVPLPPSAEQTEIVRRVKALFKIADQIETRYHKAKAYIDKLTQSSLAKAFRGELVPQDPNDEPALELLKRIKEEKAKTETKAKSRKQGRPSKR